MTLDDYFKNHTVGGNLAVEYVEELTEDIVNAAEVTIARANELLKAFGQERSIKSGWRPASYNRAIGGAARSNHITGHAVDIADLYGTLSDWCLNNLSELKRIGLFLENPKNTRGWCHLQTVAPKSGHQVFLP